MLDRQKYSIGVEVEEGRSRVDRALQFARPVPDESLDAIVAILDLVRRGRAHSRSEIIDKTGLSRAIVTQRVSELLARGFLSEAVAPSTGGRPPRQLAFRSDAGFVQVADVGATSVDVAVADSTGTILGHYGEPADVAAGPTVVLRRVEELFDTVLETVRPPGRLWGVGIGVPGPVEFSTARPVSPPIMPGWDRYPVREHFTERYGAPVWVDNDVNVMALGEWRAGVARGHPNVIFVKVGTGIGSGIISDGVMHRGAQGSAGDVGHIQVLDDASVVCRCGKPGCLEAVAGGGAIGRDGDALAHSGESLRLAEMLAQRSAISAEDVSRAAGMGDPRARELLQRSGRLVGQMLAGLVNFFNPSLIVIGGGVANAGDTYLAAIRGVIYERSMPLATRDLLVQLSSLGSLAGVTGAAAMVLDQLFSQEHLARWIDTGRPDVLALEAA
ncbi:ROK family transcriptional regulator [soil metagenome]